MEQKDKYRTIVKLVLCCQYILLLNYKTILDERILQVKYIKNIFLQYVMLHKVIFYLIILASTASETRSSEDEACKLNYYLYNFIFSLCSSFFLARADEIQTTQEEGYLDEQGNIIISKKITKITRTRKSGSKSKHDDEAEGNLFVIQVETSANNDWLFQIIKHNVHDFS